MDLAEFGAHAEAGFDLTAEHVAYLVDTKLSPLGITTTAGRTKPAATRQEPILSLRVRRALLSPSATWALAGPFSWLFHPAIVVLAITAALGGEVWLFGTQPMGSALAEALADPRQILLVGVLAVSSALFHEIGHASACRYSGVRPGSIGCGFYLVYPAFYTDITNSYQLDRRGRLRTVLGGVYFNAIFIIGLTIWFLWTGSPFLLAGIVIANLELLQQLLPTLRFDGYFIVSDLAGIPDLFRYMGPILKRRLLRRPPDDRLGDLKPGPQRLVTAWVLLVTPVLIAQLTFLALQMPHFVEAGWGRINSIRTDAAGPGTNLIGLGTDVVLLLFAFLPLAALLVLIVQAGRGVGNLVGTLQRDGDDRVLLASASGGTSSSSSGIQEFLFVFIAILLLGNGLQLLSRQGSSGEDDGTAAAAPSRIEGLVEFDDLRRGHVRSPVSYPQSPPVGGDHAPDPQKCGVYDKPVPKERAVHSMEHGAVWIAYRPDLDVAEQGRLRSEARQSYVLVSPYPNLPAPVVATAWGRQLRLETVGDHRLTSFISRFRQGPQAPEPAGTC